MVVGHLSLNKIDVFRANTTKYLKKYEIQSILGNNPANQSLTSNFVSDSILTRMDGSGAKKKFTGLGFIAISRLRECCKHVLAEVVRNSRSKIHQTRER